MTLFKRMFGHERDEDGKSLDRLVFGLIIVGVLIGIYGGWYAVLAFIIVIIIPLILYLVWGARSLKPGLPLQVGTKVVAVCNFGPVKDGAPGIIIGFSKRMYLCTFADNKKIAARPKEITDYDHGYSLEELKQPDFLPIMHEHKKQELLSLQRQTRTPRE